MCIRDSRYSGYWSLGLEQWEGPGAVKHPTVPSLMYQCTNPPINGSGIRAHDSVMCYWVYLIKGGWVSGVKNWEKVCHGSSRRHGWCNSDEWTGVAGECRVTVLNTVIGTLPLMGGLVHCTDVTKLFKIRIRRMRILSSKIRRMRMQMRMSLYNRLFCQSECNPLVYVN